MINGAEYMKYIKRYVNKNMLIKNLIFFFCTTKTYFCLPNIGERPMITEAKADLTC